jgi:hypothetical protein
MPRRTTPAGRAAQDAGTAYRKALDTPPGPARADAVLMAYLCEHVIYRQAPGLNPRLVWEGAQAAGVTYRQLKELAEARNWNAIEEFMWQAM